MSQPRSVLTHCALDEHGEIDAWYDADVKVLPAGETTTLSTTNRQPFSEDIFIATYIGPRDDVHYEYVTKKASSHPPISMVIRLE